jgi:hypothetical protein
MCDKSVTLRGVLLGHTGYVRGSVPPGPLALTLAGIAGGRLVFNHGMRVKRPADQGR